ncbi:hypothetical protein IWX90DRAFT_321985 [Phyllosticta citrichinensis]|uniref:Uncharacterized protein n=1 Tax=Phyllosticta citrichinensis TaxID=1130410 RepID=A0ABR1XJQ4_9PEZI
MTETRGLTSTTSSKMTSFSGLAQRIAAAQQLVTDLAEFRKRGRHSTSAQRDNNDETDYAPATANSASENSIDGSAASQYELEGASNDSHRSLAIAAVRRFLTSGAEREPPRSRADQHNRRSLFQRQASQRASARQSPRQTSPRPSPLCKRSSLPASRSRSSPARLWRAAHRLTVPRAMEVMTTATSVLPCLRSRSVTHCSGLRTFMSSACALARWRCSLLTSRLRPWRTMMRRSRLLRTPLRAPKA